MNENDDRCIECGTICELDFVLSKEQWLIINPKNGGVLCANCIIKHATKLPHVINVQGYISFASDYDGNDKKTNFWCYNKKHSSKI